MVDKRFSLGRILKSFGYAFQGLKTLTNEESNSWVHILFTSCIIIAGFVFQISSCEWIAVVFAIGFVLVTEIVNTAIENICDFISPARHESIKRIKDLSAAAVLVSAITALVVGLIIFIPRIIVIG